MARPVDQTKEKLTGRRVNHLLDHLINRFSYLWLASIRKVLTMGAPQSLGMLGAVEKRRS